MGLTKKESFTNEQNQIALWLKAMAHPARIAILQQLLKSNSCIGREFTESLPIAQATISQHLKEMKAAGIIKGDVEGNKVCYCINPTIWEILKTELNLLFSSYSHTNTTC